MAKARTDAEVRDDVVVVLVDLWRHVASRAQLGADHDQVAKLPTRLKKLDGLDAIPPALADQLLTAAPHLGELALAALEAAGYVVIPADWMVEG